MLGAVGDLTYLAGLEVEHLEDVAVLYECHFLAVGGEGGEGALVAVVLEQRFLIDEGRVCEMQFVLVGQRCLVEVPAAGPL